MNLIILILIWLLSGAVFTSINFICFPYFFGKKFTLSDLILGSLCGPLIIISFILAFILI